MKAVGIHVFAGGFTAGVQSYFDVDTHLEKHGFGLETAAAMCNVNIHNGDWPSVEADFAFGNPRCTGFSTITSGYDETVRGPNAACTVDIHQFMDYCLGMSYPIFIWESVQQAVTTGKPLVDFCAKKAIAEGYRVAHVLVNAASLGNAQNRRRYFFVAYKRGKNFNCSAPQLPEYSPSLYDAIWHLRNEEPDDCVRLTTDEKYCLPSLPNGWDLNALADYDFDSLPVKFQDAWLVRNSDMPFSMHCVKRLNWKTPCPTIHSSAGRFIHPDHDRGLSVKEIATIMGWPRTPIADNANDAVAQIAKGVCPCVGEWIALQARYCLENVWGDQDYESTFNARDGVFEGSDCNGADEKTFNFTHYVQTQARDFSHERIQFRGFNVDPSTGRRIRAWKDVAESRQQRTILQRLGRKTTQPRQDSFDECET